LFPSGNKNAENFSEKPSTVIIRHFQAFFSQKPLFPSFGSYCQLILQLKTTLKHFYEEKWLKKVVTKISATFVF